MRRIGSLLSLHRKATPTPDEKTVFFVFNKVVQEEYGHQGARSLTPALFKNKTLHIKTKNALWAQEVITHERNLCACMNRFFHKETITHLKAQRTPTP